MPRSSSPTKQQFPDTGLSLPPIAATNHGVNLVEKSEPSIRSHNSKEAGLSNGVKSMPSSPVSKSRNFHPGPPASPRSIKTSPRSNKTSPRSNKSSPRQNLSMLTVDMNAASIYRLSRSSPSSPTGTRRTINMDENDDDHYHHAKESDDCYQEDNRDIRSSVSLSRKLHDIQQKMNQNDSQYYPRQRPVTVDPSEDMAAKVRMSKSTPTSPTSSRKSLIDAARKSSWLKQEEENIQRIHYYMNENGQNQLSVRDELRREYEEYQALYGNTQSEKGELTSDDNKESSDNEKSPLDQPQLAASQGVQYYIATKRYLGHRENTSLPFDNWLSVKNTQKIQEANVARKEKQQQMLKKQEEEEKRKQIAQKFFNKWKTKKDQEYKEQKRKEQQMQQEEQEFRKELKELKKQRVPTFAKWVDVKMEETKKIKQEEERKRFEEEMERRRVIQSRFSQAPSFESWMNKKSQSESKEREMLARAQEMEEERRRKEREKRIAKSPSFQSWRKKKREEEEHQKELARKAMQAEMSKLNKIKNERFKGVPSFEDWLEAKAKQMTLDNYDSMMEGREQQGSLEQEKKRMENLSFDMWLEEKRNQGLIPTAPATSSKHKLVKARSLGSIYQAAQN
ncbi:hypothetical protein TrispH2_003148 [Trichoplax sp. H2]|nr:hypothetical protein TrispH2_003148 [Trichoplax sp. H2]|eukprot:RDD44966.1 hypothetical protein TrispH2_003148 [Trichoplax sp. H2]